MKRTRKRVLKAFYKWLYPLGLGWWEVNVHWISKPKEVLEEFKTQRSGDIMPARVYVRWEYGVADLYINLPAFKGMKRWRIEKIIIHELLHVLVNEMREDDISHEERVVTTLTKAVLWVRNAAHKEEI